MVFVSGPTEDASPVGRWRNVSYEAENGDVPVERFMKAVERQDIFEWERIDNALRALESLDGSLDPPYNEKVKNDEVLWELRIYRDFDADEEIPRILYAPLLELKRHVLFHAFRSKSSTVPQVELRTARLLVNEYTVRTGRRF